MRSPRPRVATLASLIVPAAVVVLLWLPVFAHYSARGIPVTDSMVATARQTPPEAVLREVRDFYLLPIDGRTPEMEIAVADGILSGRLELPGTGPGPIGLPFSPGDLEGLPSKLQLPFAGYVVPDFLVAAYAATQREGYLSMARDAIVAWDRYERSAWLPRGYLWNDHAIAARVRVLGEFWRLYRGRPDYDPEVGRTVLQQAARYRAFLADPAQFTFATNHGVMQNLGLLQLELAFPTLPDGARYRALALERLGQQLSFLMHKDGVIRENSAGYQGFGLELLGMAFRTMTLLGEPIPADWNRMYELGLGFYALLHRPDGSLPATGDTEGSNRALIPRVATVDRAGRSGVLDARAVGRPDRELSVDQAAGYWIEWEGLANWPDPAGLSQTVVTWTRPPAMSHKHADEPSVLVWSKGISWLTSVGYWPYGEPGREEAESWTGANAPHRTNESLDSDRTANLLSFGSTSQLSALDVERRGPDSFVARRQVVHLKPDMWVVIDYVKADATAANRTVWTVSPEVEARRDESGESYVLEAPGKAATARMTIVGSPGTVVEDYRGSFSPFGGWHVVGSVPQPAPAMSVEQPAGDAWTVVVLSTAGPGDPRYLAGAKPAMSEGSTADAWTITLPLASGELTLTRADGKISVGPQVGTQDETFTLALAGASDGSAERASIQSAFEQMAVAYPVFQERGSARAKLTGALAVLLLAQEAFLLVIRRTWSKAVAPLRGLSLVGWAALGALLPIFLVPSPTVLVLP